MLPETKIIVLLYYKYVEVSDAEQERLAQLELCQRLGLKGRILLGIEGINGTVAGDEAATTGYRHAMSLHPLFSGIEYKVDQSSEVPFTRLRVKVRDEIVTLGTKAEPGEGGTKLNPEEFNQMLNDPNVVLFDARNNYESAIGRFRGAVTPDINLFKDLPEELDRYEALKDKKVITYCTGGIRCEKVSALMKARGFKDVYQLDGGIIKYAQAYPQGAFEGRCFVFDGRMSIGFKDNPEELGKCHFCRVATSEYFNCAKASCNDLILVCQSCTAENENLCRDCGADRVAQAKF